MRFAIFPVHLSKVLRLPRKSDARSYEVLHLSRKIISANLKIWCSKMQPLSGNQRPDLLTSLMNMSLVLRLPREMHLCRSSSNVPRLPSFLEMPQNPHVLLTFDKVHNPLRLPRETTSERPKVVANMWCFVHFDFEMCFAPQRRALFRHLNFQKWSRTWCALHFLHFDFEMCFAPQRRALFRHLNFQKSAPNGEVFCTFWLRNVLRATTACNFSSLIWPDGSAPAALASLLFDPPEPQIIGKTQCFATFLPFRASASSFFWLFLFSDLLSSTLLFSLTLPISAFHLSILSEVWLLYCWLMLIRSYIVLYKLYISNLQSLYDLHRLWIMDSCLGTLPAATAPFSQGFGCWNCAPRHATCETNLNYRWKFYLTLVCWRSSLPLKNMAFSHKSLSISQYLSIMFDFAISPSMDLLCRG